MIKRLIIEYLVVKSDYIDYLIFSRTASRLVPAGLQSLII